MYINVHFVHQYSSYQLTKLETEYCFGHQGCVIQYHQYINNNLFYLLAYLEPFINTLGMEFVITGQYSQQLTRLEITHAHYTPAGGKREKMFIISNIKTVKTHQKKETYFG